MNNSGSIPSLLPPRPDSNSIYLRNTMMQITPSRQEALRSSVAYTPQGDDVNVFKYYCPLCMSFFRDILKSTCCGNYICFPCCFEYLVMHGVQVYLLF